MTAPRVEVHDDAPSLATAVAGALVSRLADLQDAGRDPQVALTGGTIADAVHREVARLGSDSELDWDRVHFWWGDERFVPREDPERNAGQARSAFLDPLGVDPARIHEIGSPDTHDSVGAAAAAYSSEMAGHGPGDLDVVMLGVGPDGHVASLFPGSPALDVDDRVAVGITDSPKPPPQRVSLTLAALNRAREVWFLVSGDAKADAVSRALGGADPRDIPAAGVSGREATVWFLDRPAASAL